MRPRSASAFSAIFAAGTIAAAAAEPAAHEVKMTGMKFVPAEVTVRSGDQVSWKNADLVPHTVVAPQFQSPVLQPGQTFTWTARKVEKVDYACSLHPMMKGTIEVK